MKYVHDYMVMPKLIYFVLNMCIYSTHTFAAKFFVDKLFLEIHEYGFLSTLNVVQFFGAICWSMLNDRIGHTKHILSLCTLLYCLTFCGLYFGDKLPVGPLKYGFLATMLVTSHFFCSALFPLTDATVMLMLSESPTFTKEVFGRIRLWSALGHGFVTILNGLFLGKFGGDKKKSKEDSYVFMFAILIALTISLIAIFEMALPSNKKRKQLVAHKHEADALKKKEAGEESGDKHAIKLSRDGLVRLLCNPSYIFFLFVVLIAGYARVVLSNFLGYYVEVVLGQQKSFIALLYVFRTISEVSIFFFGKPLLRVFGVYWMMLFGLFIGTFRIFVYSIIPPGGNWYLMSIPMEALKGINTACIVMGAVRIATDLAPEGTKATAQGLFSGIYSGVSAIFGGAMSSGIVMLFSDHPKRSDSGLKPMFLLTGAVTYLFLFLCFVKYAFFDRVVCLDPENEEKSFQLDIQERKE